MFATYTQVHTYLCTDYTQTDGTTQEHNAPSPINSMSDEWRHNKNTQKLQVLYIAYTYAITHTHTPV